MESLNVTAVDTLKGLENQKASKHLHGAVKEQVPQHGRDTKPSSHPSEGLLRNERGRTLGGKGTQGGFICFSLCKVLSCPFKLFVLYKTPEHYKKIKTNQQREKPKPTPATLSAQPQGRTIK